MRHASSVHASLWTGSLAHSSPSPLSCCAMSNCERSEQYAASRMPTYSESESRYRTVHSSTMPCACDQAVSQSEFESEFESESESDAECEFRSRYRFEFRSWYCFEFRSRYSSVHRSKMPV